MASQKNVLLTCGESRTGNAIAMLLLDRPDLKQHIGAMRITFPPGVTDPLVANKGAELVTLPTNDLAAADIQSLAQTYLGADVVIMIPPASPDKINQARASANAAKMAGVKNVILISSQGCTSGTPALGEFFHIEQETMEIMAGAGAHCCIIRSGHYMQNLFLYAKQMREEKFLGLPIGNGKFAPVDARDVAISAARVALSGDKNAISSVHWNQCYTITGPDLVNGNELIQIGKPHLAKVGLHGVGFRDVSKDAWAQYITNNVPTMDPSEMGILAEEFDLVRQGLMAEVCMDVKRIAPDEKPTTADEFFQEYAELFAGREE